MGNVVIRMLRAVRWTLYGLIAVLAVAIGILELRPTTPPSSGGGPGSATTFTKVPGGISIGGPFQLTDDRGRGVTEAS